MRRPFPLFAALALFAVGCAGEKVLKDQEYAAQATEAMEHEVYDLAIDKYQKLLEEYPFSEYTEEAQLKVGQAQYMNKQYAEAIASFQDFQRMHPTNPNLAFAEYYMALSYVDQMNGKDRDQRAADNAQAHLRAVIDRYPESPYAAEAKKKLQEVREQLADHELTIAKFYLYWGNPLGGEARMRYLIETYPDTEVVAEGLVYFGKYLRKQGDIGRSALAYATVVSQYPTSKTVDEAQTALEDLKGRGVGVPEAPLPALIETLGRPSLASAAPAPADSSQPVRN
jgi:outer membrane protein assembly factor BamD